MSKQKIFTIIGMVTVIILITATVIYLFLPKLYTDPSSINSYLECENTGYQISDTTDGGKTCTLPDGTTFESNGL